MSILDRWILRLAWMVGLFTLLMAVMLLAQPAHAQEAGGRVFRSISIAEFAKANPGNWPIGKMFTHVQVQGWVTYVKQESDGDLHIRICDLPVINDMDRKRCIVGEIIPEMSCNSPICRVKPGQHIQVEGISRFDAEPGHHWWEIHPLLSIDLLDDTDSSNGVPMLAAARVRR